MMYMFASCLPTALLPHSIPFTRYVKNHILDPLGLTDSTYYHDVAAESHVLAQGFTRRGIDSLDEVFAGEPVALEYWQPIVNEETNVLAGPGGLIMNGKDVVTWLQVFLLNGASPTTGEQVIPAEALALAAKGVSVPVYPGIDTATVYGAGLWSYSYGGYNVVEHDGSVPGFRSTMSRVPEAGLGIAVLSNDDMYGQQITTIVKRRILETILGLKQTDLNTETKQTVLATYAYLQNATTARPSDPTPPSVAEPSSLAGVYTDGGYGSIELCYIDSQDSCSDILAQLPDVAEGVDGVPTLIAKWDRIWTSHILLQHFDGDLWNATALDSQAFVTPEGTPTGEYWVGHITEGLILTAQFVIEGRNVAGFGITGDLWGSEGVAPTGEAEVFFSNEP